MAKTFPSDFYVTCAAVIPVLFLAVAVQGPTYESVFKAALQADALAGQRYAQRRQAGLAGVMSLLLLGIALVILIAGSVGEGLALWILYQGSEAPGVRGWLLVLTLILVGAVVAGPVLSMLRLSGLLDGPRSLLRLAATGEAEASEDRPVELGPGSAGQAPEQ
jgi:hypothetical protein